MEYDVIGDVHGEAGKLQALLRRLGWRPRGRSWQPPAGRRAVFVGDLIDRGPEQVEVVRLVRSLVDAGHAHCVLGNHEFNAIGWATPQASGPGYLRPHSDKNLKQHAAFLAQVGEGSPLHRELLAWFRTLPVALDLGAIRAVHAWWHEPHLAALPQRAPGESLDDGFLQQAFCRGTAEYAAMEGLTKGLELPLPGGAFFHDKEGVERREVRIRWWQPQARTWREAAQLDEAQAAGVPDLDFEHAMPPPQGAPIFVGHYWMQGVPEPIHPLVACVDYSAARGGPLVAYRWQGEASLHAQHFVQSH